MESPNCNLPGCPGKVVVRLTRRGSDERVNEKSYCAEHATEALSITTREFVERLRAVRAATDRCAVEIELVVCDAREDWPCQVVLHEINGPRRLSFPTGRFEAWMLAWEMRREAAPSLSTHRAMVEAMRALGGELENVAINDMSHPETYQARGCLSQGDSQVVVTMRPSDAVILATICNVPIYVEAAVWGKLSP